MEFKAIRKDCTQRGYTEGSKVKDVCGLLECMDELDVECGTDICLIKDLIGMKDYWDCFVECKKVKLATAHVFENPANIDDRWYSHQNYDSYPDRVGNQYSGYYCELRMALEMGTFSAYDVMCNELDCPIITDLWKEEQQ